MLTQEFDAKSNKLALDLNKHLSEMQAMAIETYNSRTDSLLDRVSNDFIGVRQELMAGRNIMTSVADKFASEVKQINDNLASSKEELKNTLRGLHHLEATVRDNEVSVWEIKNNPVVMLMAQAQSIAAAARAGSEYLVSTGAKKMIEIIERHFDGDKAPKTASSNIQFILNKLPTTEKHSDILDKVRRLVERLPSIPDDVPQT